MHFTEKLLHWYHQHGRHNLPWQKNPTPYRVWVSEIMLQQTQVTTVIPYYQRFMTSFPTVKSLALAGLDAVLAHWSGLGYYARARNLHQTAQQLHHYHAGRFPKDPKSLMQLPGIGRSTAGAIVSLSSMQIPATILDGNVKRVLTRFYAIAGWPNQSAVNQQLWQMAEANTPPKNAHHYNQAIMDLGATLCTRSRPKCQQCPLSDTCQAHQQGRETEFPHRKLSKSKPTQQIYLLLLQRQDGRLLLERRPPTGVWGGLWSFPECSINDDIANHCQQHLGCQVTAQHNWQPITHHFSHFSLVIKPLLIHAHLISQQIMDSATKVWYRLNGPLPGGIAAPIKNLLKQCEEKYASHRIL